MKILKHIVVIVLACLVTSCARETIAVQLQENPSNRMEFAGEQLKAALEKHGYKVFYTTESPSADSKASKIIRLTVSEQRRLAERRIYHYDKR